MFSCSRLTGALGVLRLFAPRSPVILLSVLAVALFAGHAAAQQAMCLDQIRGDASASMQWSEGLWTLNNSPVGGCVTFAGGVSTGPSAPSAADSLICSPPPNGWHWTVTIPGPYTISYDFGSFPPGYRICGDIFISLRGDEHLAVKVDIGLDLMEIRGDDPASILYAGSYHNFDPASEGFQPISAHRCGSYTPIHQGACCDVATGACALFTQTECLALAGPHTYGGDETTCDPNPCPQPPGVCCFDDGTCSVISATLCPPPASWRGDLTSCDPNPCLQPPLTGACCYPNGSCAVTTSENCTGIWTLGGVCEPNTCPPASGSCCYPGGSCAVTSRVNCAAVWTMFGVCEPNMCQQPPPTGSCCYPNGACAVTTQANCTGIWTPEGVCEPNACPPPSGSCCYPDGSCAVTPQADCTGFWTMFGVCEPNTCEQPPVGACCATNGDCTVTLAADCPGTWTMSGTCVPNVCLLPTGACCYLDGVCTVMLQADCTGVWTMFGVCEPNTCPQPPALGACCFADCHCDLLTEQGCADAGGLWAGASFCVPSPCDCPPPMGACCDHATGNCTVTTQTACGFDWLGAGVPCNVETCVPPVPTERTSWGQIKNIYR